MQELEPTWQRALSVWWLILWRGIVGSVLLSIAIIALVDALAALIGIESKALNMIGALVVWLGSIVWGVVVVRMALQKRYRDFQLALIGTEHCSACGTRQ
jgi:hypothetical protein